MNKLAVIFQGTFPSKSGLGGGQRRVKDLTKSLSPFFEETHFLVPNWNNTELPNPEASFFKVQIMGKNTQNGILNRLNYIRSSLQFILDEKIGVVLFYNTSAETVFLKWRLQKNKVETIYEMCDLHSASQSGIHKLLIQFSEKFLPKGNLLNIGISKFLIKRLQYNAPDVKTVTIPVLVDLKVFFYDENAALTIRKELDLKETDILIGYAGGTYKEEGLAILIDAFEELRKRYNNLYLVIAGELLENETHDDIAGILEAKNLQKYAHTPGWVNTNQVRGYLSAADILVLPQIKHQFNVAGLPTKSAEYSAIGKPIVVSDIGDINKYFTHEKDALLSEPSNKQSLVNELSKLIANRELRIKLGTNAFKVALANFDYTKAGDKIVAAFEKPMLVA